MYACVFSLPLLSALDDHEEEEQIWKWKELRELNDERKGEERRRGERREEKRREEKRASYAHAYAYVVLVLMLVLVLVPVVIYWWPIIPFTFFRSSSSAFVSFSWLPFSYLSFMSHNYPTLLHNVSREGSTRSFWCFILSLLFFIPYYSILFYSNLF